MKKYLIAIVALVALSLASAQANQVTITWAPNHSPDAGEFVMIPDTGTPFNTFCVERTQYIGIGNTYSYEVSSMSDGGINGPHYVSLGTAWLYSQFRNGTLNGFSGTTSQQTDLQNAIWYLQGELPNIGNNPYINLAQSSLNANILGNGNGAYGVDVWNLFDSNGTKCQSQLGIQNRITSVPERGTMAVSMALLLPLGFVAIARRRQLV